MTLPFLLKSRIIIHRVQIFNPFMATQLIKQSYYNSRVVVTLPPLDFYQELNMAKRL
jgi:hypothetical protein